MTVPRIVLLIVLATIGVANSVPAADLGLIQINSQQDVSIATEIFGHAHAMIDEKFLVVASADQQAQLARQGIGFELIKVDEDIASVYLVLPRNRQATQDGAASVGTVLRTSGDVSLVETTPSAATAVAEDRDYFVIPVVERTVYFHYSPVVHALPVSPDVTYPEDTLANLVRKDSIYAYNTRLEAFQTRYIWTDSIDRARDWLAARFLQYGYTDVSTPTFSWGGGTHYNVKAVKPGYAEPEKILVIGCHYDTWNSQDPGPFVYAPGSDDDGSGTTLTLEVARVLKNIPLRKTVVFIPFSAEEVGLVGSNAIATEYRANGVQLEAMFNYDMVGFVEDGIWDLDLSSGFNTAYRDLTAATLNRVTSLIPRIVTMGSSSDHYPFSQQGYPVVDNIETDFNWLGWHTNQDLTSRMNFDYLTEVVKLAVTNLAIVANSGSPTTISRIEDVGNGNSLELFWNDCNLDYSYKVYYGTSTNFTDSVAVAPGACSQLITGLAAGTTYYFAIYGTPIDGYRAISAPVSNEKPLVAPRAPLAPSAEPGDHQIDIVWRRPIEQDLAYFNVYRKLSNLTMYDLWKTNLTDTFFTDTAVTGSVRYDYYITSVDNTALESPASAVVSSYPATFDGGILVVDEWTQDYAYFPDQNEQEAYWDTVFSGTPFIVDTIETGSASLLKGDAGRFSSIFWMDDDIFNKIIENSNSTLDWYLSYPTNMFVCGYKTVQNWEPTPVPSNRLLNEEFKVTAYNYSNFAGFIGATGQNGWPSVQVQGNRGFARIYDTPIFTPGPGATVIYRYDAHNDDPVFEGQPCGLAYNGPNGKRVILSFPIFYLTPASATALITAVKQYFGEATVIEGPGDMNGSGFVDLSDLSMLIAYLTQPNVPIPNINGGDVNGSCSIDISDLTMLINFMIMGSPTPQQGCVQP